VLLLVDSQAGDMMPYFTIYTGGVGAAPEYSCGASSNYPGPSERIGQPETFLLPAIRGAHMAGNVSVLACAPARNSGPGGHDSSNSNSSSNSNASSNNSSNSNIDANSGNGSSQEKLILGVGIGVGLGVGLLVIAALIFFGYQWRRRRKIAVKEEASAGPEIYNTTGQRPTLGRYELDSGPGFELESPTTAGDKGSPGELSAESSGSDRTRRR
jgi:hypothetical protein